MFLDGLDANKEILFVGVNFPVRGPGINDGGPLRDSLVVFVEGWEVILKVGTAAHSPR